MAMTIGRAPEPAPGSFARTREHGSSSSGTLRLLFLVSAHNGLSQRAWIALTELGHEVAVAVVDSAAQMEAAVDEHDPELIVCPFLKTLIPESIWAKHRCLIVHPGPKGDRGPSRWTGRSSSAHASGE